MVTLLLAFLVGFQLALVVRLVLVVRVLSERVDIASGRVDLLVERADVASDRISFLARQL